MPYTMQGYVDEVSARLPRYELSAELGLAEIETYINRARWDVQRATLPMARERYGRIGTIAASPTLISRLAASVGLDTINWYEAALPADFLDIEWVEVLTGSEWWEAAALVKQEIAAVSKHTRLRPSKQEPRYYIERSPSSATAVIGISKGTTAVSAGEIRFWYVAALPSLQQYNSDDQDDAERKMSWEFEELVVLWAMYKCMEKTNFIAARDAIAADLEMALAGLEENYKVAADRKHLLLPTRESLVPNVPVPDMM